MNPRHFACEANTLPLSYTPTTKLSLTDLKFEVIYIKINCCFMYRLRSGNVPGTFSRTLVWYISIIPTRYDLENVRNVTKATCSSYPYIVMLPFPHLARLLTTTRLSASHNVMIISSTGVRTPYFSCLKCNRNLVRPIATQRHQVFQPITT